MMYKLKKKYNKKLTIRFFLFYENMFLEYVDINEKQNNVISFLNINFLSGFL